MRNGDAKEDVGVLMMDARMKELECGGRWEGCYICARGVGGVNGLDACESGGLEEEFVTDE